MEFDFLLLFIILQTVGNSMAHACSSASHLPNMKRIHLGAAPIEVGAEEVILAVGADEVIPIVPPAAEEVVQVPPAIHAGGES
jgi:hypothetical protein